MGEYGQINPDDPSMVTPSKLASQRIHAQRNTFSRIGNEHIYRGWLCSFTCGSKYQRAELRRAGSLSPEAANYGFADEFAQLTTPSGALCKRCTIVVRKAVVIPKT